MSIQRRINVLSDLRNVLLKFSTAYLMEQPSDIISFGLEYFTKLAASRKTTIIRQSICASRESAASSPNKRIQLENINYRDSLNLKRAAGRRKSVFGEVYNPELDNDDDVDVDGSAHATFPKTDAQRHRLNATMRRSLLFRSLEGEQMHRIVDAMFEVRANAGDYIIKQGDDGDNFYVIEDGIFDVYVDGRRAIHEYRHSGSFGELALMYNMPRAASVQARTDGKLWAMDRETFRHIVLKFAFKQRKMYEEFLQTVPLLDSLKDYERMNLADALAPKEFCDGEVIVRQGDAADGMYFIEQGKVSVCVEQKEQEAEVSVLEAGGYFGELALVTKKARAATVCAIGDVKVAFLDVDAFERLLGPCMEIIKRNIEDYESQLVEIFGSKTFAIR